MAFVRSSAITLSACLSLGFTIAANAALIDRGGGLIYDTDRDITWLQDANYALTSGVNLTGQLNWQDAVNWASNLVYAGYDDWRLPATLVPDAGCSISTGGSLGTGCTGGELGHMYYGELGAPIPTSPPMNFTPLPDPGLFTNLQAEGYWSGTAFDASYAYVLHFGFAGQQAADQKFLGYYAWAVRDGDIPAPGAAWLLGTGILVLIGRARRRLPSSSP